MKTVILSLQDAVETGLKDIDLLEKQDKVIFVYLKGKDTISITVHNALAKLKCKTEFYEIPDENATKSDMVIYFAFLAGSNPGAAVIDTGDAFAKLAFMNITRYPDFKSVVSGKVIKKVKEQPAGEAPARKRKPRILLDKAPDPVDPPTVDKETVKEVSEPAVEEKQEKPKKTTKKVKTEGTGAKGIEDLKEFLSGCATNDFDPAASTMSIFEAVKKTITENKPLNQALQETLFMDSKVKQVNDALQGKWSKVTSLVKEILKERGQLSC